MILILLDPRWPEMLPTAALPHINQPGTIVLRNDDARVPELSAVADQIIEAQSLRDPLWQARTVMRQCRQRGEWERSQTHASLVPYLREEVEEFIAAIDLGDDKELGAELSDIFLQVLFHAQIAAERGAFDLDDVATTFVEKLRRRAPYLFDGSTGLVPIEEQDRLWQEGKAAEKKAGEG